MTQSPDFKALDEELLPAFQRRFLETSGGRILTLTAGSGPALLLLHGDPQTHLCWRRQAAALARDHTVVLADLRGRGESHKPGVGAGLEAYAKRTQAAEMIEMMRALGHERFAVAGHDRGARVARRMALDHPSTITRLAVLDIVPAYDLYASMTAELAQEYFYFNFLTQNHPLPERLIGSDPAGFMHAMLTGLAAGPGQEGGAAEQPYERRVLDAYLAAASTSKAVTAMCQCFRAGFHIDRAHDAADLADGVTIQCPTLVLWGRQSVIGRHFHVPQVWSRWCESAKFLALDTGHFIPEEDPEGVLEALERFLT